MAHLRHPFQFLPEEVDAEFAQLLVVEAHPARSGAHGFHILGLHLAAIETDGAVSGSHFVHHAPGIVMGIGLGSEFWGVFLHEILSIGVQEPGSLGKKARLPSHAKSTGTFHTFQNSKFRMAQPAFQAMLTPSLAGVF